MVKVDDAALDKVKKQAKLTENASDMVKAINVYNVPSKWIELIKSEGQTFSAYAKEAIKAKLKIDGIL